MADAGIVVFQLQLKGILSNERDTILDKNIEALHDLRVATRRLRVAVDIFGRYYDSIKVKNISKGLKRIGNILGDARDLDVIISIVSDRMENMEVVSRVDLSLFYNYLLSKRSEVRVNLCCFLTSKPYKKTKKSLRSIIQNHQYTDHSENDFTSVKDLYQQIIDDEKANVNNFQSLMTSPSIKDLHRLRIAFKKLRYTIEIFFHSIGDEAYRSIEFLKVVQDKLGQIHDLSMILNEIENLQSYQNSDKEKPDLVDINQFKWSVINERGVLINEFHPLWNYYCEASSKQF